MTDSRERLMKIVNSLGAPTVHKSTKQRENLDPGYATCLQPACSWSVNNDDSDHTNEELAAVCKKHTRKTNGHVTEMITMREVTTTYTFDATRKRT